MFVAAFIGVIVSGLAQVPAARGVTPPATRPSFTQPRAQLEARKTVLPEPACFALQPGQTTKMAISMGQPVCFSVTIRPGEAIQLVITQPDDLEFHVSGGINERLVDGFDFGTETVTISGSGGYRVEARLLPRHTKTLTFSATARSLPPDEAARWQAAEIAATTANRSQKTEDADKAIAFWNAVDDPAFLGRAYLLLGGTQYRKDTVKAHAAFEKALQLCRSTGDVRCTAEAENNSGTMSSGAGDFEHARERLEEAARDWQKLGDTSNEARTRSNLGLMLCQTGDYEKGILDLRQAEQIQRGQDQSGHAADLNNLGLCYQPLAEYEKARGYFAGASQEYARSRNVGRRLVAQLNLGRTYMLENHLGRAQSILEKSLAAAYGVSTPTIEAAILRNLGQNFWRQGNLEQAQLRLNQALEIDRKSGDRRGESSALHYLGLVAQKHHKITDARNLLTQALRIRRESGLRADAADSLAAIADLEYHAGHIDEARAAADQALTLLESIRSQVPQSLRASFYSRKRQFFDLLVDLAMAPRTPQSGAEGLLAAERGRGRALIDLMTSSGLLLPIPADLAQRQTRIQRQIDFLAVRLSELPPERQADLRNKIQLLVAEDEELESRIRQPLASTPLGQPLSSVEELHHYLPPHSALLEFYLGAKQSYMWLVDGNQVRTFVLPSAHAISAEARPIVDDFGRLLERRRSPALQVDFDRALKKLSATLLGPLKDVPLPKLLILVPDGILDRVPLAALKPEGTSPPLGLAHDLVQVPSAAYLAFGKKPRRVAEFRKSILAMADPVFSASDPRVTDRPDTPSRPEAHSPLTRLPFTGEISTIQRLVPPTRRKVYRGFAASRATLDNLRLADFGVLHFSTHALIDDQIPELSMIALSLVDKIGHPVDGYVRPYQFAQFQLEGSIVVLSACDTALGKQVLGEGLAGFTGSLLYAGAAQLVLTLTKVDAEASAGFLREVYRIFLRGKGSMEAAVTFARRQLAHSRRFSDPYYWASFIVIGQPAGTEPL